MKKSIKIIFLILTIIIFGSGFSACVITRAENAKSAYEIWLDEGHTGTEFDFLDWLKGAAGADGKDGENGIDGADGKDGEDGSGGLSAYEIYIKYHPEYTDGEEAWIEDFAGGTLARYSVTFDRLDGNSPLIIGNLRGGSKITPPAVTTDSFAGWFKEAACINEWTVDDGVWADITLYAGRGTEDLKYTLIEDGTAYQLSGKGTADISGRVIIPLRHNGLAVTSIGESAFAEEIELINITLSHNITAVGDSAFYLCENLADIIIQGSVINVGKYAFYGCTNLSGAILSSGIKTIGALAFGYCASLKNIIIPEGVESMGGSVFRACTSLISAALPKSLTSISNDTQFDSCYVLESITVTEGNPVYKSEGNCLIKISGGVLLEGTTKSVIPAYINEIGDYAFYGRRGLKGIALPVGVTKLGDGAFGGCQGLLSVELPQGLEVIGIGAFSECSSLKSVSLPEYVSIKRMAFRDCRGLISLTIPKSVTDIDETAFQYCNGLNNINVEKGHPIYKSDGNCWIRISGNRLLLGCKNSVIPDYVESIGDYAFYRCAGLKTLTIPQSVKFIGIMAFEECTGIESLVLSGDEMEIDAYAFYRCLGIKEILIKYNKLNIGMRAFGSCLSLVKLTVLSGEIYIDDIAFYSCIKLASVILSGSIQYLGMAAFERCASLSGIIIPGGAENLGYHLFYGCMSLTIYCEDSSEPESWERSWATRPVIWGCKLSSDKTYVESITVSAAAITNPDNFVLSGPYREGYVFCGWTATKDDTGLLYGANEIIGLADGTVLYAVWEPVED